MILVTVDVVAHYAQLITESRECGANGSHGGVGLRPSAEITYLDTPIWRFKLNVGTEFRETAFHLALARFGIVLGRAHIVVIKHLHPVTYTR